MQRNLTSSEIPTLPQMKLVPNALPTAEQLDDATEDDVIEVINWWATENRSIAPPEFWTAELSRRRTDRLIARIGELSEETAKQNDQIVLSLIHI